MKHQLSYVVNCSILFTELPLLQRPSAAKAAGFDAVEFWWPFETADPGDAEISLFIEAVGEAEVRLAGLNFAAGDMPGGDRGLVSWPGREAEFLNSVEVAVGIAHQLPVPAFNALYGNRLGEFTAEAQDEVATTNLIAAAGAAARVGAVVLLEPVSGASAYPLLTASDVVGVIDRVEDAAAVENLRLLVDLYHLAVNGDDFAAVLSAYRDRIGHVQIADAPGRHEPGTGGLDLDAHLRALEATGYDGWVGLEYKPSTSTSASFDWLPRDRRGASTRPL